MKRNFQLDGFTVVRRRGRLLDLHNAYHLAGAGTNLDGTEARLDVVRNGHAIAPETCRPKVALHCTGKTRQGRCDLRSAIAA